MFIAPGPCIKQETPSEHLQKKKSGPKAEEKGGDGSGPHGGLL